MDTVFKEIFCVFLIGEISKLGTIFFCNLADFLIVDLPLFFWESGVVVPISVDREAYEQGPYAEILADMKETFQVCIFRGSAVASIDALIFLCL